mgnify:CR=1 FL=1
MEIDLKGHLILIMAPSGSGKGLLIDHIRTNVPEVYLAISCTTRNPRPGEVDGEVYYFLTEAEFEEKIQNDEFLEWAEFSGNKYGTLKSEILEPMREGKVVLREVELQGILAIRELIPKSKRTIVYIEAGSWEVLQERIVKRAPISEEHLKMRQERYLEESKWKAFADKVIENNEGRLEEAKQELEDLIKIYLK